MSSDKQGRLSEEMAERLWKRAAELQADAARRLESKSRTEAHLELVESDDSGYALEHVRQAAVEAGISTEFVEAALTELKTEVAITPETHSMFDGLAKTIIDATEPATVALLGIGLVRLAGAEVRRRRKKKAVDNS